MRSISRRQGRFEPIFGDTQALARSQSPFDEFSWGARLRPGDEAAPSSACPAIARRAKEEGLGPTAKLITTRYKADVAGELADWLNMGTEYSVSRYVSDMFSGRRESALKLHEKLCARVKD